MIPYDFNQDFWQQLCGLCEMFFQICKRTADNFRCTLDFIIYIAYNLNVEEEIVFKQSAFKHGIKEQDICNAFKQRMFDHELSGEENKYLLLGLACDGSVLEIMYNVLDGDIINVFHAMKCRKNYFALLRTRGIK